MQQQQLERCAAVCGAKKWSSGLLEWALRLLLFQLMVFVLVHHTALARWKRIQVENIFPERICNTNKSELDRLSDCSAG